MKASQTPQKTNTRMVIMKKDLVSFASCKKTSGKRMTFNKQRDAEVKTSLSGIGTAMSKPSTRGDRISDMIAALDRFNRSTTKPRNQRLAGFIWAKAWI
jgi:hypothetical protein